MEQWIEQETVYVEHLGDGGTIRHSGRSRARFVFPLELDLLMKKSGFQIVDRWGGYDFNRLKDDSPSLIVRAISI